MKIRPEGAESFHADGQANRHDETVTFHNFANALKNTYMCACWMALFAT